MDQKLGSFQPSISLVSSPFITSTFLCYCHGTQVLQPVFSSLHSTGKYCDQIRTSVSYKILKLSHEHRHRFNTTQHICIYTPILLQMTIKTQIQNQTETQDYGANGTGNDKENTTDSKHSNSIHVHTTKQQTKTDFQPSTHWGECS